MRLKAVVLCLVFCTFASAALAQVSDVPRSHWAYEAVSELANKGYVLGYPDGQFLGNQTLTRYEFATVIKRILDNLENKVEETERRVSAVEKRPVSGEGPTTSPTYVERTSEIPASPEVSSADLQKIRDLVEEFKVELTVIGTKLDKFESELADMNARLGGVEAIVTDPEGVVEATREEVKELKKIKVSGYLQARYEMYPDDVDQDGKAALGGFNVRRARAKITAKPTDNTTACVYFDAAANKASVKEAWIEYNFGGNPERDPTFTIGQMNWPFGYEVPYSSSKRETPERALWARRLFPGERDRGAKLVFPMGSAWKAEIGVFDGTGIGTVNTVTTVVTDSTTVPPTTTKLKSGSSVSKDYDRNKDVVANIRYTAALLEFGVSGYFGKGVWDSDRVKTDTSVDKIRYGADFRYFWDRVTLKTEYVRAKGIDEAPSYTDWLTGYYGQLNYNLNPRDTLVVRYEGMSEDPRKLSYGRRTTWHYGLIHWLDGKTKMKLFYQANREEFNSFDNDMWVAEWVTTF